jgi:acyl-homoserine-lactone acylase
MNLSRPLPFVLAVLPVLTACGGSGDIVPLPGSTYNARVTRTEYGIPHVQARDWGSLGYGHGYSYAQDNYCVLMREIVFANGRSAEWMGEAEGDVNSDFIYTFLHDDAASFQPLLDAQPAYLKDLVEGYAQGMNRYLQETGVDRLPEGEAGCRSAPWVREITHLDLWKYMRRIALQGSTDIGTFRDAILNVQGPDRRASRAPSTEQLQLASDRLSSGFRALRVAQGGSNAIALGRNATRTGTGMLLGNPHQPWQGSGRWYEVHLTIPGVYDVMGATLQGMPMVGVGFNGQLAWSHTVSYANRFTLYELQLNPADPMQYLYDGEMRDITARTVQISVKREDGTLESRSHTFYSSHYGLIVNLRSQASFLDGWPMFNGRILCMRDANLQNVRGVDAWVKMGQAQTLDAFLDALKLVGNPAFHTLAADRQGNAFYGDISAVPHVTQEQLDRCMKGIVPQLLAGATNNAVLTLDGATSSCEWGSDPDSPPGSHLYGYGSLPKFTTADYAANSNNSYWLSDANHPLTGFPVIMGSFGHEGEEQLLRTRLTHQMVSERSNATDGLSDLPGFTLDTLQGLMYSNRVLGAELNMEDILSVCATAEGRDLPADVLQRAQAACAQLARWDRRVDLDSRGAHLFTEFWNAIRDKLDTTLWRVDFDPADPVHTPRGFDTSVPANHDRILKALSEAVEAIQGAGLYLDDRFGDVQFFVRNEEIIPIHGGMDAMGAFGVIKVSLEPGGYQNIRGGNSYIQTVTWDDTDCPVAEGMLTHSQSTDPASPHYGDQTPVYSAKGWIPLPYCAEQVEAARIGPTLTLAR